MNISKCICIAMLCLLSNVNGEEDHKARDKKLLKPWQNGIVGATVGTCEPIVNGPLITIKNALQHSKSSGKLNLSFHPRDLWRGAPTVAASMAPTIALQTTVHSAVLKYVLRANKQPISIRDNIIAACSAGAFSSLVVTPAELIQAHQQKRKLSFTQAFTEIKRYGWTRFYRGVLYVALREAGFTSSYLAVAPILKEKLDRTYGESFLHTIAGGIIAGVAAAQITHPSDTIKTRLAQDVEKQEYKNSGEVIRSLWKGNKTTYDSGGFKAFFKGAIPRITRSGLAVSLILWMTPKVTQTYFGQEE